MRSIELSHETRTHGLRKNFRNESICASDITCSLTAIYGKCELTDSRSKPASVTRALVTPKWQRERDCHIDTPQTSGQENQLSLEA